MVIVGIRRRPAVLTSATPAIVYLHDIAYAISGFIVMTLYFIFMLSSLLVAGKDTDMYSQCLQLHWMTAHTPHVTGSQGHALHYEINRTEHKLHVLVQVTSHTNM